MSSYRAYKQDLEKLRPVDTTKPLQEFSLHGLRPAKVVRCVDGDTVDFAVVIDGRVMKIRARLVGIDTPELRPRKSDPNRDAIKREAQRAKLALQSLMPVGTTCSLTCGEFDNYGRLLVESVNVGDLWPIEEMVRRGFAIRVANKKREKNWGVMWQKLNDQRAKYESDRLSNSRSLKSRGVGRQRWWRKLICGCQR